MWSGFTMLRYLFDNLNPSFRSFDMTHLDAGKCIIQFLCNFTHFLHTAWEADLFAMIIDLSNRRNNSCGSTKSTLCKIFYFVKVYFSFFYFKTKDISCDCYERTSCDRRKNTAALWCNHFSIFCNKDEVCSTGLFYLCS